MNPRNLTREAIEQLNDIEPYCFETDREEQWYNVGLKNGLEIADEHPKSPWISVKDDLPCNHEKLIFKHSGVLMTRLVFVLYSDYSFRIIKMYKFGDKWLWEYNTIPSYWMYLPELPKE